MSKITLTGFALLLLLFLGNSSGNYAAQSKQKSFRSADRHASKNDRRKRQRHDATRSQPVERQPVLVVARPHHLAFRSRGQFFLPRSGFQRSVTRARARLRSQLVRCSATSAARTSNDRLHTACLRRSARLLSGWRSKNFLQIKLSILQFATATQDSLFSTSKDIGTITMPPPSRLRITGGRLSDFKTVCQRAGSPIRRWRSGWNNFHRRGDATDRDRPAC